MRRTDREGKARIRRQSPTRSLGTGSRSLPERRASRSPYDAVSIARHSRKQYLYHYARIRRNDGRETRLAELTTGALLLVIGAALSVIGVLFFPFLCIGIPLLIVGVILIVAEGGQVTKSHPPMYPAYPGPYGYPPYAPLPPPAQPAPPAGQPPAVGTGRFCTNCGSPVATGMSFCPSCGTRLAT